MAGRGTLRAALLTGALVVTLAACSDDEPADKAEPSAAGSSPTGAPAEESDADPRLAGAPELGTCWRMPPATAADPDYWYDDSPQVPCTERHTLQTVAVYPLDKPTPRLALEQDGACDDEARLFIGTNSHNWVPWRYYFFLPSREQIADGASWVRCDVAFAAQTTGLRPTWATRSAEEVALRHPEEVWGCLDRFPAATSRTSFVPCDKPHAYEATGHLLFLVDLDSYPSPRELRAAAADCEVAHRDLAYKGMTLHALWRPPDEMWGPDRLIGTCWASRPDGQDLPPLE